MMSSHIRIRTCILVLLGIWLVSGELTGWVISNAQLRAQEPLSFTLPEQKTIRVRDPSCLIRVPMGGVEAPYTVGDQLNLVPENMSLDEAIRIAVENADVVRVLTGVAAASSGRTVYDVAISNTSIDVQNSTFDPVFNWSTTVTKPDSPFAVRTGGGESIILGANTETTNTSVGVSKRNYNGATVGLNLTTVGSYFEPGIDPLAPQNRSVVEATLRQPLMRGYGRQANLAPVVVARLNTERSYFQFKDSVQELVRGVINAYWSLVSARVDVWARQQQIKQAEFAYQRAIARKETGLAAVADVAQARSALANFRAGLLNARSTLILRETALRNILGLDPSPTSEIVPTSEPTLEKIELDWDLMVALAEEQRPDIIELKLVLEADQQLLMQADNQARPQFDGIANYRWNGLSGVMPNGNFLDSSSGQFAGFNLGVNFSVPVGLRQTRASLRRQELVLARDRINLDQRIYSVVHQLAINYRNLDQFYLQIQAFREAREAARLNFDNQVEEYRNGRREFINALQAITDWGNAVSLEAQSVTQYNTELANIEQQTGTILEAHGIRFYEERFGSLGPVGPLGMRRTNDCYPAQIRPEGGVERYPDSQTTSEEIFNLEDLSTKRNKQPVPGVDAEQPPVDAPEFDTPEPPPTSPPNEATDDNRSAENVPQVRPSRFSRFKQQLKKTLFR